MTESNASKKRTGTRGGGGSGTAGTKETTGSSTNCGQRMQPMPDALHLKERTIKDGKERADSFIHFHFHFQNDFYLMIHILLTSSLYLFFQRTGWGNDDFISLNEEGVYFQWPSQLLPCNQCKKRLVIDKGFKKCSRCQWARYCGRHCQKKDWNKKHRLQCKKKS